MSIDFTYAIVNTTHPKDTEHMNTYSHELMHGHLANRLKADAEQYRLAQELQANANPPSKRFIGRVGNQLIRVGERLQDFSN